jgi:hypothetical protein
MLFVFIRVAAKDQNVVDVDNEKFVRMRSENVVHKRDPCYGSVAETEGHDQEFEMTKLCVERGLGYILVANTDLVVGTP